MRRPQPEQPEGEDGTMSAESSSRALTRSVAGFFQNRHEKCPSHLAVKLQYPNCPCFRAADTVHARCSGPLHRGRSTGALDVAGRTVRGTPNIDASVGVANDNRGILTNTDG